MKKLLITTFSLLALSACDGLTDREESCLDNGGKWEDCTTEGRHHQREMARIEARQHAVVHQTSGVSDYDEYDYDYPEVEADKSYTNYYGDPQHGSWSNGSYRFNDPHGQYASSTNSFLIGAGVGGLLGYMGTKAAMRSNWNEANPNGYTERKNTISKKELKRRKEQSRKDKAKKQAKLKKKKVNKKLKASKKKKVKANKIDKKLKRKVKQKASKKKQFAKKSTFNKSKRKSNKSKKRSSSKKKRK